MTPNQIRAAMLLKNVRPADIARRLNVTRGAVSNVISGLIVSQRIREAVAEAIGKEVDAIWPLSAA
ncbi:helix-turn-helix domain-containing protein [Anaeromusa acidaminophila]|uniref:helix-turn-helix domain-containing protein n=1 Tax=Anaeromusa acidaminophila TaxID=81464 RepID=UPI0003816AC2|nr:helix-turn-helix transcriptional regulator [Anaeromusa acidaminophila]